MCTLGDSHVWEWPWKCEDAASIDLSVKNNILTESPTATHRPPSAHAGTGLPLTCVHVTKGPCGKTGKLAPRPLSWPLDVSLFLWIFTAVLQSNLEIFILWMRKLKFRERVIWGTCPRARCRCGRTGSTPAARSLLCGARGHPPWPPLWPFSASGLQGHCFLCLAQGCRVEISALPCHPV